VDTQIDGPAVELECIRSFGDRVLKRRIDEVKQRRMSFENGFPVGDDGRRIIWVRKRQNRVWELAWS
jgi:hypothetical protein